MKKSGKQHSGKRFMIAATVILLALSAAAFGARFYLSQKREKQKSEMTPAPEAVIMRENFSGTLADGLKAGANLVNDPAVKITAGTAFVRFNVELSDSDGVSFGEKLEAKKEEIDEYESLLNPESPSYLSFCETYYRLQNEYAQLYAKGLLAFRSLCRDGGADGTDTGNIGADVSYTEEELRLMSDSGKISLLTDEDADMDGESEFVQLYDGDNPFSRQYVYKKSLAAGESCALFTNIIVPSDWEQAQTSLTVYEEDEDGNFSEQTADFGNMELIGDGFGLKISAEVVDTEGFTNPIAAFETAENLTAVTEISSDTESN